MKSFYTQLYIVSISICLFAIVLICKGLSGYQIAAVFMFVLVFYGMDLWWDGDINSGDCLIKDKASVTGDIRVNHLSIDGADTSGLILQIRPREVIALSNSVVNDSVENPLNDLEACGTGNIPC
jgi:hypothetical protein